jgi:hypothetical protein
VLLVTDLWWFIKRLIFSCNNDAWDRGGRALAIRLFHTIGGAAQIYRNDHINIVTVVGATGTGFNIPASIRSTPLIKYYYLSPLLPNITIKK